MECTGLQITGSNLKKPAGIPRDPETGSGIAQNPRLANVDFGFHKMGSKVKEKRQFLSSVQIFMTKKTFLATPRGDLLVLIW